MRNRYLVTYDVSDDKRLRQMHRTLLGFGDPLQYSVFSCDLSSVERILLLEAIGKVMNQNDDRVMIADLGPSQGRARRSLEWLGRATRIEERRCVVV